jgi:hypothetical protein
MAYSRKAFTKVKHLGRQTVKYQMRWYRHISRMNKENFKNHFEHGSDRKTTKRKTEVKMGTTGWERRHTEGRKTTGDRWKGLVIR